MESEHYYDTEGKRTTFSLDKDSNSDYLERIESRKNDDLSNKGKYTFYHVGFKKINNLKFSDIDDNILDLNIIPILHFDTSSESVKLEFPATMSFIIELNSTDDDKITTFTQSDTLKLFIKMEEIKSNKQDKVLESIYRNAMDNQSKLNKWNFKVKSNWDVDYSYLTLKTFLLLYIWESFLSNFRKKIKYDSNLYLYANSAEGFDIRFSDSTRFINGITSLKFFLIFESFSLSLDKNKNFLDVDAMEFYNGKHIHNMNENHTEWRNRIASIFQQDSGSFEPWKKRMFMENLSQYAKRDLEGSLYFNNKRIFQSYIENTSTEKAQDPSVRSLRWDVAFAVLLGDYLCTMAEKFIIYNERMEELSVKDKNMDIKKMGYLLRAASLDFKTYYDNDMILIPELRSALETAKETFLINDYHDRFIDKIRFFSDYEIEENEEKINSRIAEGGKLGVIGGVFAYIAVIGSFDLLFYNLFNYLLYINQIMIVLVASEVISLIYLAYLYRHLFRKAKKR